MAPPSFNPGDSSGWEARFAQFLAAQHPPDIAHDLTHVRRVVLNARRLAVAEGADQAVVVPAAWLHDCVTLPKDSPKRRSASRLAAEAARTFLLASGYSPGLLDPIAHAIEAHSFSAGIAPQSLEAAVVQDADRLDALGAIGLARCLMLGGALNRPLYDPDEPFPIEREPDDRRWTIDHFYSKLLHLPATMCTATGRAEAVQRVVFLHEFLRRLGAEITEIGGWI
jgi:uncharacterized protein